MPFMLQQYVFCEFKIYDSCVPYVLTNVAIIYPNRYAVIVNHQ
jgi:hypothetical protein